MKKTAIILALCLAALSGCGRVDSVDVDSDITPFEIEKTTDENSENTEDETLPDEAVVTTVSGDSQSAVTTARTGAVNLVKRTGNISAAKTTVAVSRATVRVGTRTNSYSPSTPTRTTTVAPPVTTSAGTSAPGGITATVQRDDMVCRITESGISVSFKGEPVQNIDIDTSYMLEVYENGGDASKLVNINDFDFDGYFDLFIPNSNDDYNIYGSFLRYNPNTALFEKWDAMSGITTFDSVSAADGTFTSTIRQNNKEFDEKTYEWRVISEETGEKELRLVLRRKQFMMQDSLNSDYNIYIDYYEYPDGVETITKREKHIYDENGDFLGVEEVPIEWLA